MLEEILGSSTRARILEVLIEAEGALGLRELVRRVGGGVSGVQRETARLRRIGLLTSERLGNRCLFALNRAHPLLPELTSLVRKARAVESQSEMLRVNAAVRPFVPAIIDAASRHGVVRLALFGSSTQAEDDVTPRDLDVLVTFGEDVPEGRADAYFELLDELQTIVGMKVDIVVTDALRNPYLKAELEATEVVLYEAA